MKFYLAVSLAVLLLTFISTGSGRKVNLEIYVEAHDLDKTRHAMESLKRAMAWDEQRFGLGKLVQDEALEDELAKDLRCPDAEPGRLLGVDPVADGDDGIEAVEAGLVDLAIGGSSFHFGNN